MRSARVRLLLGVAASLASSVALAVLAYGGSASVEPPGLAPDDGPGIARALATQEESGRMLLDIDGVIGTGVTLDDSGQARVVLFTESPYISDLPEALDGVPVEVEVTGRIRSRVDATRRFERPVPIGVSAGHLDVGAGTIAARVTRDGDVYALSNSHVFANSGFAGLGDSLLQPAVSDGGEVPEDVFGTLAEFEPIDFTLDGSNTVDAALALSSATELAAATPEDGYGAPSQTTIAAFVGQDVQKYGRTTGLTRGVVEAVNVTIEVCYAEFFSSCVQSALFDNQIAIADVEGAFSLGGDSGSLIVTDDDERNPVGLLFAGGGDTMFINPIDAVLDAFGVTFDVESGSGAAVPPGETPSDDAPSDGVPGDDTPSGDAPGEDEPADAPAPPVVATELYLVISPATIVEGPTVEDEDVVVFDGGTFRTHFDGSDVGLDDLAIDAVSIVGPSELLLSFTTAASVAGVGLVDDSDVVLFTATSLGEETEGEFSLYFDGSDVGLTRHAEDVDAVELLSDGRIVLSTRGRVAVPGLTGRDEDLLAFTPTSRGADTVGTWARHFDGSDVALDGSNNEDVDGAAIVQQAIYLSTRGRFSVVGLEGEDEDVVRFDPATIGTTTAGDFATPLELDGSAFGLDESDVVAFDVVPVADDEELRAARLPLLGGAAAVARLISGTPGSSSSTVRRASGPASAASGT